MTAVKPADLDLFALAAHVKTEHAGEQAPRKRTDLARTHAIWHNYKKGRHTHGGEMISVEVGPGIFSVHPRGWFTGQEAK